VTLRLRFALWVAALLIAALVIFGAFVYFSLAQGLSASIDDSLRLSASQAIAVMNIENGQINFSDSVPEIGSIAADLRERGLTIRIIDPMSQIIQSFGPYRDLPILKETMSAVLQKKSSFITLVDPKENDPVRVYTAPVIDDGQVVGIIQIAESLGDVQNTLARLLTALLLGGSLLALVSALGGYFIAARALAPIDHITQTARRISAEDLTARLNLPATHDEVGRLAGTFDEMLTRLDDSFRRERQFTADASHELRTPLAAMQAILSVIREHHRTTEDYEQALDDLSEEADRLRTLTEDLLQLARGETQQYMIREKVDLTNLLRDITDSLRPLAEAKGLALICNLHDGLVLLGDSDALIRLFVNLLDNAIKYSDQGGITIAASNDKGNLSVAVADTGIGIPSDHLPYIFDRFYRVDKSRLGRGAGLGLAIAKKIANSHGGRIDVESIPNKGTIFTVRLPGLE
jgi:heavy metal sensor kinase